MSSVQDRVRVLASREASRERPRSAAFDRAALAFSRENSGEERSTLASRAAAFEKSGDEGALLGRENSLQSRAAIFEQPKEEPEKRESPPLVMQRASLFEKDDSTDRQGDDNVEGVASEGASFGKKPDGFGSKVGVPTKEMGTKAKVAPTAVPAMPRSPPKTPIKEQNTLPSPPPQRVPLYKSPALPKSPQEEAVFRRAGPGGVRAPPPAPELPNMTSMSIGMPAGASNVDSPPPSSFSSRPGDDDVSSTSFCSSSNAIDSPESSVVQSQSESPALSSLAGDEPSPKPVSFAAAANLFGGPAPPKLDDISRESSPALPRFASSVPKSPSVPDASTHAKGAIPSPEESGQPLRSSALNRFDSAFSAFDRSNQTSHRAEEPSAPVLSPLMGLSSSSSKARDADAASGNIGDLPEKISLKARQAMFETKAREAKPVGASSNTENMVKARSAAFEQRRDSAERHRGERSGSEHVPSALESRRRVTASSGGLDRGGSSFVIDRAGTGEFGSSEKPLSSPESASVKVRSSKFGAEEEDSSFVADSRPSDDARPSRVPRRGSPPLPPASRAGSVPAVVRRVSPFSNQKPSETTHVAGIPVASTDPTNLSQRTALKGDVPRGGGLMSRLSLFEQEKDIEHVSVAARRSSMEKREGFQALNHSSSLPAPETPRTVDTKRVEDRQGLSEKPLLQERAAMFEGSARSGAPEAESRAESSSPFVAAAARFRSAENEGPPLGKTSSEPLSASSGIAARSAAFEMGSERQKPAESAPQDSAKGVANRAAVFEKSDGESKGRREPQRIKQTSEMKNVFTSSSIDPLSPTQGQSSSVFGTMSGHADARRVVVPKVGALSGTSADIASLVRMNGELVATLLQLKSACTKIEQSKEELKERIRALEAQAERQGRRR